MTLRFLVSAFLVFNLAFASVAQGACPNPPVLDDPMSTVTGGPFSDCGMGLVGLRSPSPTALPHGFGDNGALDGSSICHLPFTVQNWWVNQGQPDIPDIRITDSDRLIHNSATFPGDVIFYGQRIEWVNQPGVGSIVGNYVCAPGASDIEVDGVCICGGTDSDGDQVADFLDNCTDIPNGPNDHVSPQMDFDNDGYGNACDFDYDNGSVGNGACTTADFSVFFDEFNNVTTTLYGDHDANGDVTTADFVLFNDCFQNQSTHPVEGPSGLSCAGTQPCP